MGIEIILPYIYIYINIKYNTTLYYLKYKIWPKSSKLNGEDCYYYFLDISIIKKIYNFVRLLFYFDKLYYIFLKIIHILAVIIIILIILSLFFFSNEWWNVKTKKINVIIYLFLIFIWNRIEGKNVMLYVVSITKMRGALRGNWIQLEATILLESGER